MKRLLFVFGLIALNYTTAFAQVKTIKDAYFDFTQRRSEKGNQESIIATEALLKRSAELTPKQLTSVEYYLGRMYEEVGNPEQAIPHYENAIKGEPDYFVVHRALGFIFLSKTKVFVAQMNAASAAKNTVANVQAFEAYKGMVLKAIPHLEKYQACEPDEQTLTIITNLYKSIKDTQSIATLDARLKPMAIKCVSLLDDE